MAPVAGPHGARRRVQAAHPTQDRARPATPLDAVDRESARGRGESRRGSDGRRTRAECPPRLRASAERARPPCNARPSLRERWCRRWPLPPARPWRPVWIRCASRSAAPFCARRHGNDHGGAARRLEGRRRWVAGRRGAGRSGGLSARALRKRAQRVRPARRSGQRQGVQHGQREGAGEQCPACQSHGARLDGVLPAVMRVQTQPVDAPHEQYRAGRGGGRGQGVHGRVALPLAGGAHGHDHAAHAWASQVSCQARRVVWTGVGERSMRRRVIAPPPARWRASRAPPSRTSGA